MEIKDKIKDFLKKYNINGKNLTYLVAFSGGADSLCLLDNLIKIAPENKIIAIHLNHGWRGEESDLEEENCKNYCKKNNILFYSEKLDSSVPHTESAARDARYKFFSKCAEKFNSNIIFTAHNMNDNAETVLFRIVHGTGIAGLQGICEKRDIYYRPLLTSKREEIESYCKINNLCPNIDSSNSNVKYNRNFIRNNIFPMLSKINSDPVLAINSLINIAKEENSILDNFLEVKIKEISENNKIKTELFLNLEESLQRKIIYKLIKPLVEQNYDKEKIFRLWNFIMENKTSKSGKIFSLTTNFFLFVSEKYIEFFLQKNIENAPVIVDKEGEYKFGQYYINISKCSKQLDECDNFFDESFYVDFSGVNFNFVLRHRQDGDIISPLGMSGHQKFKKYLNSKHIPNHEKDNLILLCQDKEVLLAFGAGLNNKIKTTQKPTHIITLRKDKN